MPQKSLRCIAEIEIHSITSPGTWLVKRDDLYVTLKLFGQVRRTRYVSAIFPLTLHEKFKFDKVFYNAYEPAQVADSLEDLTVRIELIQMSSLYEDGRLLAWYEGSARDFLYPYPHYNLSYGTHDRELLLDRTLSFPGISPRMEFSTKTIIQQTVSPTLEPWDVDVDDEVAAYNTSTRRSRSRTRARSPSPARASSTYGRPTISSITRARSVSPLRSRVSEISLDNTDAADAEDRPPFVVRRVQKELIGRKPGTIVKRSQSVEKKRSSSPTTYRSSSPAPAYSSYSAKPEYTDVTRSYKRRPYSTYDYDYVLDRDLLDSAYYRHLRAAALSPAYYRSPTFRDYYDERPWSATYAEVIRDRVRRALRRDRVLEDLDPVRTYRPYSRTLDTLSDLELDFELARRRKYYL